MKWTSVLDSKKKILWLSLTWRLGPLLQMPPYGSVPDMSHQDNDPGYAGEIVGALERLSICLEEQRWGKSGHLCLDCCLISQPQIQPTLQIKNNCRSTKQITSMQETQETGGFYAHRGPEQRAQLHAASVIRASLAAALRSRRGNRAEQLQLKTIMSIRIDPTLPPRPGPG